MIKRLSVFFATIFSVMAISGCAMLDLGKIGVGENDPETQAEKVVATLHNHIRKGELESIEKYFVANDDTTEMYRKLTDSEVLRNSLNEELGEVSGYISQEKADKWLGSFTSKFYGVSDYRIDEVTANGDIINVAVTMQVPDFSQMTDISAVDTTSILEECFAFDVNDANLFFEELALRKGVEENELRDIYSSSDESVWISDILELFSVEFDKCFSRIFDEVLAQCPMKNYRIQYTVEKQANDAWKITDVDND